MGQGAHRQRVGVEGDGNMTAAIRPGDRECIRLVAALLGCSSADVRGKGRCPSIVRARWACMVALRRRKLSYPEIGQAMGGKDHSTVMNACDIGEFKYATDLAWLLAVDEGVRCDAPAVRRRGPKPDMSDPREACIGLLSVPGRVPPEACRAALVLMSLAAGLPVPPVPPVAPAAC